MVAPGVDHNEGISVAQSACEWEERGSMEKEAREGNGGVRSIKRHESLSCVWVAWGRQVVYSMQLSEASLRLPV